MGQLVQRHRRLLATVGMVVALCVLGRLGGISVSVHIWSRPDELWDASIRDRQLDYYHEVIMTEDDRKALMSNRVRAQFPKEFVEYDNWQTIAPPDYRRVPRYPCFSDVNVLIIVMTTAMHYESRAAIRSTWGQGRRVVWPQRELQGQAQVIFALGVDPDSMWEEYVQSESERHGDLLQGTEQVVWNDAHTLPTYIFRWTKDYCPSAQHLCYVDDDMFVNVPHLLESLAFEQLPHTFLIPYLIVHEKNNTTIEAADVIRRGAQSREVFVMSTDLADPLYRTMKTSPLLVEHTAVTCAAYARGFGARVVPSADLMQAERQYVHPCDIIAGSVTVLTGMTSAATTALWADLQQSGDEC